MSTADINKWNGKYRFSDTISTIEPDEELVFYQSLLPQQGVALDLACGLGKNTLFLAQNGLMVTAIDASAEGLKKLGISAQTFHLEERIKLLQADFDNFTFAKSCFDLILVVRYLNRALFYDIEQALKPGGLLIYKTFNHAMLQKIPEFNPAYTIETAELIAGFRGLNIVASNREDSESEFAFMIGLKAG